MEKKEEKELFKAPEKPEVQDLVKPITDPKEQERLLKEAEEARKLAKEMLKHADVKEDGTVSVPLVTSVETITDPSDKIYLLIFEGYEKETEVQYRDWQVVRGRRQAYEAITLYMENDYYYFDLYKSKILVDVEQLKEAKSIYDFLEYIIDNNLMNQDEDKYPDIDDYVGDIEPEEDETIENLLGLGGLLNG